jgi:cold shock protein
LPAYRSNRPPRRVCGRSQAQEAIIATGTVRFFNTNRGYGFIQPSNNSPDVFVHVSAVRRAGHSSLVEGQRVSFEILTEGGKSAAGNLKVNPSHLRQVRVLFRRILGHIYR